MFLRGKLKGLFFFFHGHRFFSAHLFSFIGSMAGLSKWIQQHKKLAHTDFYSMPCRDIAAPALRRLHLGRARIGCADQKTGFFP